uniref:Ig-like domain-containing protein n=1 Tax=Hucho hucho TaxID=62062 RepID=A0A4W5JS61_9TELE
MFSKDGCLALCTVIFILLSSSEARGPPWVSRQVEERQTARLGRTVRLACPVEGDPPPLVLWVKDGRNVHPGWSRYRVLKKSLKIKEVELGDAGVYMCRVTNGFGSITLNYTLIVMGKAREGLTSSIVSVLPCNSYTYCIYKSYIHTSC